eukprot:4519172-Alexandrium_andersonii.AAC.1
MSTHPAKLPAPSDCSAVAPSPNPSHGPPDGKAPKEAAKPDAEPAASSPRPPRTLAEDILRSRRRATAGQGAKSLRHSGTGLTHGALNTSAPAGTLRTLPSELGPS